MKYDERHYTMARQAAAVAHQGQTYEIFPYTMHLDLVVDVIKRHGLSGPFIVAGYLHDAMEDGALTYSKIKRYFGEKVAEMVLAVTDEIGRNRKEKKTRTLAKIAGNEDATILKLADRIANVEFGKEFGGKVDMYRKEYRAFRQALYNLDHSRACPLWRDLDVLMGWVGEEIDG